MLSVNFIRQNKEKVIAGLKIRNFSEEKLDLINQVITLDDLRKSTQTSVDELSSKVNKLSSEIGALYKSGKADEAGAMKAQVAEMKGQSEKLKQTLTETKTNLTELLYKLPNIPNESVPPGTSEEDNEVFKAWEQPLPKLADGALPHWELAEKYDIINFALGAKITGAGFPLFKGKGSKLQRALINFFFYHTAM